MRRKAETPLPRPLIDRIAKVTRRRYQLGLAEFKRQRASVIDELRERHVTDSEIARLLGVTVQYLTRVFTKHREDEQ